jgi:hypothetical protein
MKINELHMQYPTWNHLFIVEIFPSGTLTAMHVENNDKKGDRVTEWCVAYFSYSLRGGTRGKG